MFNIRLLLRMLKYSLLWKVYVFIRTLKKAVKVSRKYKYFKEESQKYKIKKAHWLEFYQPFMWLVEI